MIQRWWERWPGRLESELQQLEAAGIAYERDNKVFEGGVLRLNLWPAVDGETLRLLATFPDIYPYTRFEVAAPELDLPRHHHPFSKNLCLIGRGTSNWKVTDTLASFIQTRLPAVLKAARSDDLTLVGELEEHQGEPFSDYYHYEKDTIMLVDSSWSIHPAAKQGELTLGIREDAGPLIRGAILDVRDGGRRVLAQADQVLARLYPKVIRGRWARVASPVKEGDPQRFLARLLAEHPELRWPIWQPVKGWRIDVVGVLFPEEIGWRLSGDGWVFVIRAEEMKDPGRRRQGTYLARAGRAGRRDFVSRIPELASLHDRRIAVIGLGCLGAPSALEFARCGVGELRLLDGDVVEAGTIVRWPLGVRAAGLNKTEAIVNFIAQHYPFTKVAGWHHQIGATRTDGPSDLAVLDQVLDGVHLVYDATAEVGIQHLLSDLARDRGLPYLCISTTPGAWGGVIARIRPGRTQGCWVCLQHALEDGIIPTPPADPSGGVQPEGCANPTFTGAGFDVGQIALSGVRLAVSTLTQGTHGGYPDIEWDVAVIHLRGSGGELIAPRWETFPLPRHPKCAAHDKQG